MVGGPEDATDCSFSVTLGILFAGKFSAGGKGRHGPASAWPQARGGASAADRVWSIRRHHPGRGCNRDRAGLVTTHRAAKANSYPPSNTDTLADSVAQTHTDAGSDANPNTHDAA
jgi:hypothetical protein